MNTYDLLDGIILLCKRRKIKMLSCVATQCFRIHTGPPQRLCSITGLGNGGRQMSKRLRAMLLGTDDAVPSDYVLGLVAVLGIIVAVLIGML